MTHRDQHTRNDAEALEERGTLSSGNVFADLGFEDAETELVKADLALALGALIERRGLSQRAAAQLLGTTQPKVSLLLRGRTEDVSVSKLIEHLNRLAQDVTIQISPTASTDLPGRTKVILLDAARAARAVKERVLTAASRVAEPITSWPETPMRRKAAAAKGGPGFVAMKNAASGATAGRGKGDAGRPTAVTGRPGSVAGSKGKSSPGRAGGRGVPARASQAPRGRGR